MTVLDSPEETPAIVLGIETSCDETAAAVVSGPSDVLSSVISSQVDLHARYGVVPEIASRAHVELAHPVVAQAVIEAGLSDHEVEAVAATAGPGLIGSLLVGVERPKSLALVWDVPFVAVNTWRPICTPPFWRSPTWISRWWCCWSPAATPCWC